MTDLTNPLLHAATLALHRGWHIFGAPVNSKATFRGSHGSRDALNDDRALERWEKNPDANPCVRLDWSGLMVLDADHGLTSPAHAEEWAKRNGIPETYIVTTGRVGGGFHFYFKGVRDSNHPDVIRRPARGTQKARVGFELDGVSGDIKCRGHVVLEGGIHKSGATYVGNGKAIAPAPQFLLDYRDPADVIARARQAEFATKRAEKYPDSPTKKLRKGDGRHNILLSDAGRLRQLGLGEQAIYLGLKDIAARFFEDGDNYDDGEIRRLAHDIGEKNCDRVMVGMKTGLKITVNHSPRSLAAQALRRLFPVGHAPASIQTIVVSINNEYPRTPMMTLRRAMNDANFQKSGKDSADARKTLWIRRGTKKR